MACVSVKGVARRYLNVGGSLSVRRDVLHIFGDTGPISLRFFLESIARREFRFDVDECIYEVRAAFEQTWSHIRVRIRLDNAFNVPQETLNALKTVWENGIRHVWSNVWGCGLPGESTCPLTFEVQWVDVNEHHVVLVIPGSGHTVVTAWHTQDSGAVAAHEFGHMLGHPDEYESELCPDRLRPNEFTVMNTTVGLLPGNSSFVPARLMAFFALAIRSALVRL